MESAELPVIPTTPPHVVPARTAADDSRQDEVPRPADVASHASDAGGAELLDEPPPTVDQVKMALRRVKDPDLNLNIIDLGLVYDVAVDDRTVKVDMSLTSPACPSGPQLMGDTERAARAVPGVRDVVVNLVWSPLWSPERIEPRVRAYLGF